MILFGMITTAPSSQYTKCALDSFFAQTKFYKDDRFVLIDNDGGFDRSLLPANNEVVLHVNSKPLGFGENCNFFIDLALKERRDLLLLNNDLFFTKDWIEPIRQGPPGILSPLSNREVQYSTVIMVPKTNHILDGFHCLGSVSIENFSENQNAFLAISDAHRRHVRGYHSVIVLPFFCVKIPHNVLTEVGHFDLSFGKAGGEDYDYALRARLAGFDVGFALGSFVLHFGGKSSWDGVESESEQVARENHFFDRFQEKWGKPLHDLILKEHEFILSKNPELLAEVNDQNFKAAILGFLGNKSVQIKLS